MYIPKAHHVTNRAILDEFITMNGFATLISTVDDSHVATHLPLILDRTESAQGVLLGHVARANPHWRAFDGEREALAIFHGPHTYISPSWCVTPLALPTWNYAVVHVYGAPRVVDEEEWVSKLVDRLIAIHEAGMPEPWPGDLPTDFKANLLQAIVGFVIEIERVEGKFKLAQNRPLEDQLGIVRHLEASPDPVAQALGAFTKKQFDAED